MALELLVAEFEQWSVENNADNVDMSIVLLDSKTTADGCDLSFLLAGEYEFLLTCPKEYPNHSENFFCQSTALSLWCSALNEFLLDSGRPLKLEEVLTKAVQFHKGKSSKPPPMAEEEDDEDEDEMYGDDGGDDEVDMDIAGGQFDEDGLFDDDESFTTNWELEVARKKKRWARKEEELREEREKAKDSGSTVDADGSRQRKKVRQIFSTTASSGVLANDLIKIIEHEAVSGVVAEPIDDNIYHWSVKLSGFEQNSDLAKDLNQIMERYGYDHLQLEMTFVMDLHPFYPPSLKVVRPRLQGSLMQRVTSLETLKLSYWNPARDMRTVIGEVKDMLQAWARLDVDSPRNDPMAYPMGAYTSLEHLLLQLALVSEVTPRANHHYVITAEPAPALRPLATSDKGDKAPPPKRKAGEGKKEFWKPGVGFGHNYRTEWDVQAYLAAKQEKDKQVEVLLNSILCQLTMVCSQDCMPSSVQSSAAAGGSSAAFTGNGAAFTGNGAAFTGNGAAFTGNGAAFTGNGAAFTGNGAASTGNGAASASSSVDFSDLPAVSSLYTLVEGSCLVPFIESYLDIADSFLEVSRHSSVYMVLLELIQCFATHRPLQPLLLALADQRHSLYELLRTLSERSQSVLSRLAQAKAPKGASSSTSAILEEQKFSTRLVDLFANVKVAAENIASAEARPLEVVASQAQATPGAEVSAEKFYCQQLRGLQFASIEDSSTLSSSSHHYFTDAMKESTSLPPKMVFRIAQELSSLQSSLPLEYSSTVFVRAYDDHINLLKALVIGPGDTPYSGGCFEFDIHFPSSYPNVPPRVNLATTNHGSVRFNPNLYACGKVCLSLLGTWDGQKGEQWNPETSTVLQVLISIQSLILVTDPFFNEPGFEREIGTETGLKHSKDYNAQIQVYTIRHAMTGHLRNPPPCFRDVIRTHFYLKRDHILKQCKRWLMEAQDKSTPYYSKKHDTSLTKAVADLEQELRSLRKPL